MNNNFLAMISTEAGIYNLFRSVNGVGNYNCFFLAYKEVTVNTTPYIFGGAIGGAIGALAAGVEAGEQNKYAAYLLNQTENGIAFIPLLATKSFSTDIKTLQPDMQSFSFIGQNYIESVVIKKYAPLNKKTKKINIKIQNGDTLKLYANINEKLLPYQEKNISMFMNKYIINQ